MMRYSLLRFLAVFLQRRTYSRPYLLKSGGRPGDRLYSDGIFVDDDDSNGLDSSTTTGPAAASFSIMSIPFPLATSTTGAKAESDAEERDDCVSLHSQGFSDHSLRT